MKICRCVFFFVSHFLSYKKLQEVANRPKTVFFLMRIFL